MNNCINNGERIMPATEKLIKVKTEKMTDAKTSKNDKKRVKSLSVVINCFLRFFVEF